MVSIFLFVLGAIIGSFANVLIYRIPRKESIVRPRSRCPECEHVLGPFELIPVLSYLCLRGRCRACGGRISIRYFLVEISTAMAFVLAGQRWTGMELTFNLMLFMLLVVLALIDLEHKVLPDRLTLPGAALGLILNLIWRSDYVWQSVLGAVAGFSVVMVIALLSNGGMGGGDAKLLAMIGAFLGLRGAVNSLLIGSIFGAVVGLILIFLKKATRKDFIPFGPFLAIGAWWSVVAGGIF